MDCPYDFYGPKGARDAPPAKALLQGLHPAQVLLANKAYDADWIKDIIHDQN